MRKTTGSYHTYSIPGKTPVLVPEFAVEVLPSAELQPRFLRLLRRTYPWAENTDDDSSGWLTRYFLSETVLNLVSLVTLNPWTSEVRVIKFCSNIVETFSCILNIFKSLLLLLYIFINLLLRVPTGEISKFYRFWVRDLKFYRHVTNRYLGTCTEFH